MNTLRALARLSTPAAATFGRPIAALLGMLALNACDATFDPGTQVDSLRVLAVRADSPFVHPGDTVHLSALSYDPAGRPINWAWAACPSPAGSSVEDCLDQVRASAAAGELPLLGMGEGVDNIDVPVPSGVLDDLPIQVRSQLLAGVLSVACPGDLEVLSIDARIPFRCTDRESGAELGLHDMVVGIKRLFLRETEVNQNPVIDNILFDGETWLSDDVKEVDGCVTDDFDSDDCKDTSHKLAAVVSPDSFEAGNDEFGRNFTEQLVVQHYTTDGIFEDEVRLADDPETKWTARNSSSGNTVSLWFVVHDDRGGVSWTTRKVHVR
jgi:hypothetical protein